MSLDGGSAAPPTADVPACGSRLVMSPDDHRPTVHVCTEPAGHRGPHADAGSSWSNLPATDRGEVISTAISGDPTETERLRRARQQARQGLRSPLDRSGVAGEPEATTKGSSPEIPTDIVRALFAFWDCYHNQTGFVDVDEPGVASGIVVEDALQLDALSDFIEPHETFLRDALSAPENVGPTPTPTDGGVGPAAVNVAGGVVVPDEAVEAARAVLAEYATEPYGDLRLNAERAVAKTLHAAAPLIAARVRSALLAELIAEADVSPGLAVEATSAPEWTRHWRAVRDWLLRQPGAPEPAVHVVAEWREKYGPMGGRERD